VQYHPSLCYGIIDQTPDKEAHFLRLPAIHRDDVAEFCGQSAEDETGDDDALIIRLLEKSHARRLFEGHRKPAWRLVVFKHGGQWCSNTLRPVPSTQMLSIAFLANHAVADGLSHTNFFRTFFHFFNSAQTERFFWPLAVPKDLRCPVLLEDVVDLKARDESDNSHINDDPTNIWSGANMFLESAEEYSSSLRLVTIPQASLSNALQFCKMHKITLTGLLNSLLVTYLSKEAPIGHGFRAFIPYSMRHITKVANDEICNHASGLVSEYPEPDLAEIRSSTENSSQELQLIVNIAQDFRRDMAAELARCPKNNVLAGMVGIEDWYGPSLSQLGKKRALTYGISNFGCVPVVEPTGESKDAPLRLEKMIASQYVFLRAILFIFHTIRREFYAVDLFCLDALKCMHLSSRNSISLFFFSFDVTAADRKSQRCGSVTGPGFGFNSISIPGGPLTITLTWQKGVVEEQFMDRLATYLSRRLMLDFKNCVV
jgi:hypothetical protein